MKTLREFLTSKQYLPALLVLVIVVLTVACEPVPIDPETGENFSKRQITVVFECRVYETDWEDFEEPSSVGSVENQFGVGQLSDCEVLTVDMRVTR